MSSRELGFEQLQTQEIMDRVRERTERSLTREEFVRRQYVGTLGMALQHHFKDLGFKLGATEEYAGHFISLEDRIKEKTETDHGVPVLFQYPLNRRFEHPGFSVCALVIAKPNELLYRSERTRRENMRMDPTTQTASGIEYRKITLEADTLESSSTLTQFYPSERNWLKRPKGYLLNSYCVADTPYGYDMDASRREKAVCNIEEQSHILVGWDEIEESATYYLRKEAAGDSKPDVARFKERTGWIKDFFAAAGQLEALNENAPILADYISAADSFPPRLPNLCRVV